MKKKVMIFFVCILLAVLTFFVNTGLFETDRGYADTDMKKVQYEYYYNENVDKEEERDKLIGEMLSSTEPKEYIKVDTDPDSYTVLVNRDYLLPKNYVPKDLVVPDISYSYDGIYEKSYMRKTAARALEKLFAGAAKKNIHLEGVSAYRSYERQSQIYRSNIQKKGKKKTNQVSALPGSSEHQTGLSIDVSCSSINCVLEESFGETPEGKWLAQNCYKYGFIIRYPEKKEKITGYSYEPWHIRYVGKNLAEYIWKKGLHWKNIMN